MRKKVTIATEFSNESLVAIGKPQYSLGDYYSDMMNDPTLPHLNLLDTVESLQVDTEMVTTALKRTGKKAIGVD